MYIHNAFLNPGTALFSTVNSTNQYLATASIDGNISVRSIDSIRNIYNNVDLQANTSETHDNVLRPDGMATDRNESTNKESVSGTPPTPQNITKAQFEVTKTPDLNLEKVQAAQKTLNIVGVRSRSKITSLRYANLLTNANLLAAIYKNGEVYIVTNPQDVNKCRIQKIFKHINGLLLDFAWSADDQLMAFTSMNNEVIVYDVIYGKIISNLHLHMNTQIIHSKDGTSEEVSTPVKGLAFDKLGTNCLFTLGDDKVLNVVKYQLVNDEVLGRKLEYKIVTALDDVINSSKLNKATIKKISLSPDDKVVVCPNTLKSKSTKLSLVSEKSPNTWEVTKELTAFGLKSFMTLFSPNVYKNKDGQPFYLIASLATDTAFSIWRTDEPVPLYIVLDMPSSILDFSWTTNGLMLFLTHQNGSMSVLVFKDDEFGKAINIDDKAVNDLHRKTRELLPIEFEKMTRWRAFMKDNPELVKQREEQLLNEEKKKIRVKPVKVKTTEHNGTKSGKDIDSNTAKESSNKNVKDKENDIDKNKKKNGDDKNQLKPTEKNKSNEKENDDNKHKKCEKNKTETKDVLNTTSKSITSKESSPAKSKTSEKLNSSEHIDKTSGEAKIKEKVENVTGTASSGQESKKNSASSNKQVKENPKKRPLSASNYNLPSNSVPKDLNTKVVKMQKKDSAQSTNGSNTTLATTKKKREVELAEFVGSVIINPQISFSNIRIAIPKLRNSILYQLPEDEKLRLQIKNGNGLESQPTRISLVKEVTNLDNKQIFVDFVPHRIHIVCGSSHFLAMSTPTGQILTYSQSGRRILPAIVLGSPLSFLELKDNFLLAVVCTGELYVWDLTRKKSLFKPISLYPLLQPLYSSGQATINSSTESNDNMNITMESNGIVFSNGELLTRSENLTMCSITSEGIPIVTLSNGNGYLFNRDMNTWSLISDAWWAFGSQYWDSTLSIDHLKDVGLLEYMESNTNEEINRKGKAKFFTKISKMMLMKEGYENLETVISLNHLENKINFYLLLNDYKNYKTFLIIYAKRLCELNLKNRLLEILNSLFVDMAGCVCGKSKGDLLQELILSCSKHREVQHILVQFSESIGLLAKADDSDLDIL